MILVNALVYLYPLHELINTSVYFFVRFFKIDLFGFSIFWAIGYYMMKHIIFNNITAPTYCTTTVVIYKGTFVFITRKLNSIWVFREFINMSVVQIVYSIVYS